LLYANRDIVQAPGIDDSRGRLHVQQE
jgi:hypothetical protein